MELQQKLRQIDAQERDQAIATAQDLLKQPLGPGADSQTTAVYQTLNRWSGDPRVKPLVASLSQRVLQADALGQALTLGDQLKRVLQEKSSALRRAGILRIDERLTTLKLSLIVQGLEVPQLDGLLQETQRRIEALATEDASRQAAALRDYQRWALSQIDAFNHDFQEAEKAASENTSLPGEKWADAQFLRVRDSMCAHLLSIATGLLDPPVAERYNRAFKLGWDKLDGRQDQTYVAEQDAVVVKKPLRDLMGP